MATYKTSKDISTLELAGVDIRQDVTTLSINGAADDLDASTLVSDMTSNSGQRQYTISMSLKSQTASCPVKVNSSHMTLASIGGVDYKAVVRSIDFTMNTSNVDVSAAADVFKSMQNLKVGFEATAEIMVLASATHALFTLFKTSASSLAVTYSITLNGTTITVPMVLLSVDMVEDGANIAILRVSMKSVAPCTGDFPTAPTTGTDLLTGFLVDGITPVTFDFASAATNGEALEILVVLTSLSFSVANGQLVEMSYNLMSTGAPV